MNEQIRDEDILITSGARGGFRTHILAENNTQTCVVCGESHQTVLKTRQSIGLVCDLCMWYPQPDGSTLWVSHLDAARTIVEPA